VVSLLVAGLFDETVALLPFGALEPLRRDLDLSYAQGAALLALYPGIGVVGGVFGVLADRHSRRLIAAGGALGYAAGLLLFAAGTNFTTLVVAIALMGFAGDAMVRATDVALVEVAGAKIELAVARATLLGTVGDLAGPALLAVCLATGLGWRAAFVAAGLGMAGYALLLASQPLPDPSLRSHAASEDGLPPRGEVVAVLRDRRVFRLGLLSALVDVFDEPFLAFAIAYLVGTRGQPAGVATLTAGVGMAGGVAAAAWASRAERSELSPSAIAALLVGGVGAVVLAVHPVVAALGAAGVGAAVNLAWISLEARILTLRPGQAGTTSAVVSAVGQAAVLVPLVAGVLADAVGVTQVLLLYLAMAVVFAIVNRRERGPRTRGVPAEEAVRSRGEVTTCITKPRSRSTPAST
jgi:predicted MFS family arabinose efflux permease